MQLQGARHTGAEPAATHTAPCAQQHPPQPIVDGQMDRLHPRHPCCHPAEPPSQPKAPRGEALARVEGRTFPSGAALMSAAASAAYRPRSDSLISLRRYKSLEMPSCKLRGAVVCGGTLHTAEIPGTGFSPSRWDAEAPTVGSQGGQGPHEPQNEKRGAPEPPLHPRHTSAVPPRGMSAPRPQTDPMKTITAPVESNQARCSVMLAGPGWGSTAYSPPPDMLALPL